MAKESNSPRRKVASGKRVARRPAARLKQRRRRVHLAVYPEFKPDGRRVSVFKPLHFTHLQWMRLLRWLGYTAVCTLCLLVQDSIMSRVTILGGTTDLAVAAMLVIGVIEGCDTGGVFLLIASIIYYFSGSAPGPYVVGRLTILGLAASLFRQAVLHRSRLSIVLCAGAAGLIYEIGLYIVGLFLGLTLWYRFPRFLITGLLTAAVMFPIYEMIFRIGQIGGYTWKE